MLDDTESDLHQAFGNVVNDNRNGLKEFAISCGEFNCCVIWFGSKFKIYEAQHFIRSDNNKVWRFVTTTCIFVSARKLIYAIDVPYL